MPPGGNFPSAIIERFDTRSLPNAMRREVGNLLADAFRINRNVRQRGWTQSRPAVRLVALIDNAVVGHQGLVVLRRHEPFVVGLSDLVVASSYRRKGIGRALIYAAVN